MKSNFTAHECKSVSCSLWSSETHIPSSIVTFCGSFLATFDDFSLDIKVEQKHFRAPRTFLEHARVIGNRNNGRLVWFSSY